MGVPKAIDFWVDLFSIIVTGMVKGIVDNEEIEFSDIKYENEDGEEVEDTAYRGRTMLNGKEVMKWVLKIAGHNELTDFLKDPRFKSFPLFNPSIQLTVYFLPRKIFDLQFAQGSTDVVSAFHSFDSSKKSLSKIGSNTILVNQGFGFEIYLKNDDMEKLDVEKVRKLLKPTIGHELTHCYETYNRVKTSGDPFQGRESILNSAIKMMDDFKYPSWSNFLHLVYLHLSFEVNARVTQIYYELEDSDIKTTEEFMDYLKKTSAYKEAEILENFDAKEFIDNFEIRGLDFFQNLEDIGRQRERLEADLPPIYPKKTSEEGMRHLIEGWDVFLQTMSSYLNKQGVYKGKLMDLVPQKAIEDPYLFFKFFENRFHKKAERFKKKLMRVSSLIINKELFRGEELNEVRVPRSERVELYKDDNIIVVVPLTHRALQKYATNCQWCINDDSSEWKDYHQGKHVVIIQRKPKEERIGITGNPIASEILIFSRWGDGYTFNDVQDILGYEFESRDEAENYYLSLTNDINNFATNIVYYSPENGIYDMEDNFLWNFNYEINNIPNVTPEVIKIMDDYLNKS